MKDLVKSTHREGKKSRSKIILQEDKIVNPQSRIDNHMGTHTILHNFSDKEKANLIE